MQKTKSLNPILAAAVMAVFMAAGSAHAQAGGGSPTAAQGSVTTVDQLIKKENAELLAKMAGGSVAAAPGAASGGPVSLAPPPPSYRVESIYGTGSDVRADVTRNGEIFEGVARGEKIGQCVVAAIVDKCVKLSPAKKGVKGCNDICWTGEQPAPPMGIGGMPGGPMPVAGAPLPQPLRAAPAGPAIQPMSSR